ncbi:carboxylesterase/lipase family protein [Subtercola lobariae]|uniref:Carboxylic ester hydrolase n=1 Tax=Subtercola lobariae TaxID=1588641 RepID=A0A917F166_9MICO|nr:carboxylesterase family protein [Subtercola lobariae]GGF34688.1 carboxylic ester hydrolase [Subtercola lobariae]
MKVKDDIVAVSSGEIQGVSENGISRYLGVPYAAAPVGDLRFALPQPHPGWSGVRDATSFGATAPQARWADNILDDVFPTVVVPGDEYLNVNVWTPDGASALPVMVWVHGGALSHGSIVLDSYDGTTFARDGVVYVSISYRLGTEGFSVLDGASNNLGLADVIAAARWVKAEIGAFGGDPDNITLFGESGGSILIGNILALPDVAEICTRMILESGLPRAETVEQGRQITVETAAVLGVEPTRDAFAAFSQAELVKAQEEVTAQQSPLTGGAHFTIVNDGQIVPDDPSALVATGPATAIPILLGTTTEEANLWVLTTPTKDMTAEQLDETLVRYRISPETAAVYRANRPDASPAVLLSAILSDLLMRLGTNRLADARLANGATTHVFEFAWPSPVHNLGAAHATELGFVFDRLLSDDFVRLTGADAPQQVADDMHAAWIAFAKTGDPGWQRWNETRPVYTFDAPRSGVTYAPRDDERSAWNH